MIANARMYSVDAATTVAWRALLEWIVRRADVACEVVDYPPPQPLPALWSRDDLGCAFMCGYPFARAVPRPVLLAAPVPSPSRYAGEPMYWSDLVVHVDSPVKRIDDTFGLRFAHTSDDSQSGYHAARRFLAPYAGQHGTPLFASTVGPLMTPRSILAAIVAGDADVGPVDSYAHDLLRLHEPALTAQVRTIASTERTPIPALVGSPAMDSAAAVRLVGALCAVEQAPELVDIRNTLLLKRFAVVAPQDYDELISRAREADRLGYSRIE
jgi:ABC-type phosphate/phosphonate transport system substrate-binding protein